VRFVHGETPWRYQQPDTQHETQHETLPDYS
jgi:hypothetical protein